VGKSILSATPLIPQQKYKRYNNCQLPKAAELTSTPHIASRHLSHQYYKSRFKITRNGSSLAGQRFITKGYKDPERRLTVSVLSTEPATCPELLNGSCIFGKFVCPHFVFKRVLFIPKHR
jgi:hypothetical protein